MELPHVFILVSMMALLTPTYSYICDTAATSSPNAPPYPMSMESDSSYQARVEVTILDKNYTMVVDEYLDYPGNRALLKAYRNGKQYRLLYTYDTNEIFHISIDDQTCKVMNTTNDPSSFLFGPVNYGGLTGVPQMKIFGVAGALRFSADKNDIYNGTGTVRGVPVDIWYQCVSWPGVKDLMKLTFYFARLGWNNSSPMAQPPMRIEIEGNSSLATSFGTVTLPPSSPRYFHHIYDIINFQPVIFIDPTEFETPLGIVCPNRRNTHQLPQFQNSFTYRAEIVDPISKELTHYAVWYMGDIKLVREDKRTINPDPALNTQDPITEIHDFETGVRYIMDQEGGCAIRPIDTQSSDSKEDMTRFKFNQSLVVDIRDPNSFFRFNENYRYVGQRQTRNVICDVFSAIIPNFQVDGTSVNATFEYYFLSDDYDDLPLDGQDIDVRAYPVQLVISAQSFDYSRVYNFYDYAETFPIDGIYDVSNCFPENQKLTFKLTFPGYFVPKTEAAWIKATHMALLTTMQVHPVRITDITVEGQDFNTFVTATLLGTANAAQFEKLPASTKERLDDKVFVGVTLPDECADLCIKNSDFVCNAFQYCPNDGYACRLLKNHIPTTDLLTNFTECDAFSRTVAGVVQREPFIREAYSSLAQSVANGNFIVMIPNPSMSDIEPQKAINVQVLSGQPIKNKTLPVLPTQFSYRLETVLPQINSVRETFIWYDSMMNIVRYDTRDATSSTPFMMTQIHDFLTGVAYEINQVTKHCKVSPIGIGAFDVVTGQPSKDGSLLVSMKSPQSLFFLDNSYIYVGEKTVRGILCDVFESQRNDFNLKFYNMSQTSVFRFYFQADGWDYVAPDSTDITRNQPVMLEIEDVSTGSDIIMNFYDFNNQHYTVSHYDTSSCIDPKQKRSFIITFKNQPAHPILDQAASSFLNSAILMMSEITMSSPIRFQQASVTFDDSSVYVRATALGKVPAFPQFTYVMDVGLNSTAQWIYANTPEDCAASCLTSANFICNSFDLCNSPSVGRTMCLLGQQHKESEGNSLTPGSTALPCSHYSRSENVSFPNLDVGKMYEMITDNVYDNLFQITMDLPNNLNRTYVATDVRDDLFLPSDPNGTPGYYLKKFVLTPKATLMDSVVNVTHDMVSVTDCAVYCLQENTFSCQTFDYKFTTGKCRLTSIHPDEFPASSSVLSKSQDTSVYSRLYTDDYIKYDIVDFTITGDKIVQGITSDEMCAKSCSFNSDFVCESFDYCTNSNCILRKLHKFNSSNGPPQAFTCRHYSRRHLFDYIPRNHKTLQLQFASMAQVTTNEECAYLCSSGTGLVSCASFTVCTVSMGVMQCSMTTSDPTVSSDVVFVDNYQCMLYTRANHVPVTSSTTQSSIMSTNGPTTSNSNPTIKPSLSTTSTGMPSGTASSSTSPLSVTDSGQTCTSSSSDSSNTGPRVGIAFGTLILGFIVGALCIFLFKRHQINKPAIQDVQMLQTMNG